MSEPDFSAELAHARMLTQDAIDNIDLMGVSESLPDELWSEEAAERVYRLVGTFSTGTTAQTERAYLTNGEVR